MNFRTLFFTGLLSMILVAQVKAPSFNDLYTPMEAKFFSSYNLSADDKVFIKAKSNDIKDLYVANPSSLSVIQKTYFVSLLQNNFLKSTLFDAADKAIFTDILKKFGVGSLVNAASGYVPLSTRIKQVMANLGTVTASTFQEAVDTVSSLLSELPAGTAVDKGNFSLLIKSLKSRGSILQISSVNLNRGGDIGVITDSFDLAITFLTGKVNNISISDQVAYLNRASDINNFKDVTERNLFKNLMLTLSELLSKMKNTELIDFQNALTSAYSSPNFTDADKASILSVSDNLVAYFNANAASLSSEDEASSQSVAATATPDNFLAYLNLLKTTLENIKSNYQSGDRAAALNLKNSTFTPLAEEMLTVDPTKIIYLADMITSDYLIAANNIENIPQPASGSLVDEQAIAISFFADDLNPAIARTFSSDGTTISGYLNKVKLPINLPLKLQYISDFFTSRQPSVENKIRILWHAQYLVNNLSRNDSGGLTTAQRGTLRALLIQLSRSTAFKDYQTNINGLITRFDSAISANPTAATEVVVSAPTATPAGTVVAPPAAIMSSLADEMVVSFRFGKLDPLQSNYLSVSKEMTTNKYFVKIAPTTPMDLSTQFKIKKFSSSSGITSVSLESILFPGYLLKYNLERATEYQDLDLVVKPSSLTAENLEFLFNIVSSSDKSSSCIVSLSSLGYLSSDSTSSITTMDFSGDNPIPFLENSNSNASISIVSRSYYNELRNIMTSSSGLNVAALSSLVSTNISKMDDEFALTVLKEIYSYVYKFHAQTTASSWNSFLSNSGSVSTFLDSLLSGNLARRFSKYSSSIDEIQSLINFIPGTSSTSLYPNTNGIFWLTENNFTFSNSGKIGLSFGMKSKGVFSIYLLDFNNSNPNVFDLAKSYQIKIGDLDASGTRLVSFYYGKSLTPISQITYPSFDQNNLTNYQVIFEGSTITLADGNGTILIYKDNDSSHSFIGGNILFGLRSANSLASVSDIESGLNLFNITFLDSLAKESYSQLVDRVLSMASSINTADKTTLDLISSISMIPFRLQGNSQNWDKILSSARTLLTKPFINTSSTGSNTYSAYKAKSVLNDTIRSLTTAPSLDQVKAFLEQLYGTSAFLIKTYVSKTDALQLTLQTIVKNNLELIIKMSNQDQDKTYVRDLIARLSQVSLFQDPQVLVKLATLLDQQISINVPQTGTINDKLSYLAGLYSKISTIGDRTIFLKSVSDLITTIKTSGNSASDLATASSLLDNVSATTVFKDVLGSVSYLKDLLSGSVVASNMVTSELATENDFATKKQNIQNYVFKIVGFEKQGIDNKLHSDLVPSLITQLNNAKTNVAFAGSSVDIDFWIGYLNNLGDMNALILSVNNTYYLKINNISDRDLFLSKFENMIIKYFEFQINLGSATDDDRKLIAAEITKFLNNSWFKDSTANKKLVDFSNRISAVASPITKINEMKTKFENLSGDQSKVTEFAQSITALSAQINSLIISGDWYNASDIQTFNSLVDNVISRATSSSDGGYYLLWIMTQPNISSSPLVLSSLKISVSGDMSLIADLNLLMSTLSDGQMLKTRTGINAFLANFQLLVTKWRLMVTFNPTTANISENTSFKKFYLQLDSLLDSVAQNPYLIASKNIFDEARNEVLENVFDMVDRVSVLNDFFTKNPQDTTSASGDKLIGGKTLNQVRVAILAIVAEFKKLAALHFHRTIDSSTISGLLDICILRASLDSYKNEFIAEKNNLNSTLNINSRVAILNSEFSRLISANEELSQVQQDNILKIIETLRTTLNSINNSTQLESINFSNLKSMLTQLVTSFYFSNKEILTRMSTALTAINGLSFNGASQTTPTTSTQTSSTTTINPTPNLNINPTAAYTSGSSEAAQVVTSAPATTFGNNYGVFSQATTSQPVPVAYDSSSSSAIPKASITTSRVAGQQTVKTNYGTGMVNYKVAAKPLY